MSKPGQGWAGGWQGIHNHPVNPPPTSAPPGGSRSPILLTTKQLNTEQRLVRGSGNPLFQPEFDPKALSLPALQLTGGKLSRGYIFQDPKDTGGFVNGHPLGFRFLYNPTQVEMDYQINTSILPTAAQEGGSGKNGAGSTPLLGVPGAATLSFDLILDRTFDVNDPSKGDTYRRGIRVDVEQWEKMLAYNPQFPFIQPIAMYVFFGHTSMMYYGYIQGFSVLYTNWTTDMRPYRGGITGISMPILPLTTGSTGNDVAAASGTGATTTTTTPPAKKTPAKKPSNPTKSKDSGNGRGAPPTTTSPVRPYGAVKHFAHL